MKGFRCRLQHHLNPLHVYCRLRTLGVDQRTAKMVSACYEKIVYRFVLA
ncbi:hypothetical protein [Pseudodesulfovibrio sp.]